MNNLYRYRMLADFVPEHIASIPSSGANAHRIRQFNDQKENLSKTVDIWGKIF
jgi:hypothetical protein